MPLNLKDFLEIEVFLGNLFWRDFPPVTQMIFDKKNRKSMDYRDFLFGGFFIHLTGTFETLT